jgi:anthranilate phosphoribosyltransferase
MASIKTTLQALLVEKRKMKPAEAKDGMKDLMSGNTTPAQAASFLTALQAQSTDMFEK